MTKSVYLDHAATTPVRDEVMAAMAPFFGPRFGNPSSVHSWGREARVALDEARERLANCLGATPAEICFTSGGTEGDNFAILGTWHALAPRGRRAAITTPIEHKAVLATVHHLIEEGGEERLVRVSDNGVVDADHFTSLLDNHAAIASVMWVNNEVGVIQDIIALGSIARDAGVVFHTDAVQAFGKVNIDLASLPVDLLTISGHKIGAPKGIGALFIRRDTPLSPIFHGGSQDRGRRPGTENVAFAVGLATAAELAIAERDAEMKRLGAIRDRFETMLHERIPGVVVNAAGTARAPHLSNFCIPGTDSESMLMALDLRGIACSAGSACQSGSVSPSHVLSALGVPLSLAGAALRFSFGKLSTNETPDQVVEVLVELAEKAKQHTAAANSFAVVDF